MKTIRRKYDPVPLPFFISEPYSFMSEEIPKVGFCVDELPGKDS